jgi:hypothetical protein
MQQNRWWDDHNDGQEQRGGQKRREWPGDDEEIRGAGPG